MFGLAAPKPKVSRPLRLEAKEGNLLAACDRFVTADRKHTSHVVTFLANPYEILPYSAVYRRDTLPTLGTQEQRRYQRTLFASKLHDIRSRLLDSHRFIFPNSVLAVLAEDCSFDSTTTTLEIPDRYGALIIIDGQHRLFSYANEQVRQKVGEDAQIVVTAVAFDGVSREYIDRFSARTFIEINTNQTRVSSLHLFGIGYEILGDTHQKYLAAHVLRKVNARQNKTRGLLRTSDSPRGKIKSMEIVGTLGGITNVKTMASLTAASGPSADRKRSGFQHLLGTTVAELANPEAMTEQGIVCVERYFNLLAKHFKHDWPEPGQPDNGSAFGLTKFFAALIRLLRQFIDEGATWATVEAQLQSVKANVLALRGMSKYDEVLFVTSDAKIPDATARISDMFRFLQANRSEPRSVAEVVAS